MLDFAALWVSKGVAGFMRAREGASKGVAGFIWARKSSPCARKMAQNRRFMACWANFFAEESLKGLCWAKFFAEMPLEARCRANFFAPTDIAPGLVGDAVPSKLEVVGVCTT